MTKTFKEKLEEINTKYVEKVEEINTKYEEKLNNLKEETTEEEIKQYLKSKELTEDCIGNEELFTFKYSSEIIIPTKYHKNLIEYLKKDLNNENITTFDLKKFINTVITEVLDNYSFMEEEVSRNLEIEYNIKPEEVED